jgi:hypothetical protein
MSTAGEPYMRQAQESERHSQTVPIGMLHQPQPAGSQRQRGTQHYRRPDGSGSAVPLPRQHEPQTRQRRSLFELKQITRAVCWVGAKSRSPSQSAHKPNTPPGVLLPRTLDICLPQLWQPSSTRTQSRHTSRGGASIRCEQGPAPRAGLVDCAQPLCFHQRHVVLDLGPDTTPPACAPTATAEDSLSVACSLSPLMTQLCPVQVPRGRLRGLAALTPVRAFVPAATQH